jgi:hypothetical protein
MGSGAAFEEAREDEDDETVEGGRDTSAVDDDEDWEIIDVQPGLGDREPCLPTEHRLLDGINQALSTLSGAVEAAVEMEQDALEWDASIFADFYRHIADHLRTAGTEVALALTVMRGGDH